MKKHIEAKLNQIILIVMVSFVASIRPPKEYTSCVLPEFIHFTVKRYKKANVDFENKIICYKQTL